jgi:hypothetical protein
LVATAGTIVRCWWVGTARVDLDTDQPSIVPCSTIEDADSEFVVVHLSNPHRAGEAIRPRSGPRRLTPGPAPA